MDVESGDGNTQLTLLRALCSRVPSRLNEGGREYIKLPGLRCPGSDGPRICDALLEPKHANSTYPTKLYLLQKLTPLTGPALNWNDEAYVDAQTWYSWSWKDIRRDQPLVAMVAAHLEALR